LRYFVSLVILSAVIVPLRGLAQTVSTTQKQEAPPVTTILPASTAGVVLVNTTAKAWSNLSQFNPLPERFQTGLKLPFETEDFNLKQDVLPWLGDRSAIATLPVAIGEVPPVPRPVLLLPIKDTSRFNTFLGKFKNRLGKPQIERSYKGVTILQWISEPPAPEKLPAPKPTAPLPETRLSPLDREQVKALKPDKVQPPAGDGSLPLPPFPAPSGLDLMRNRSLVVALFPNVVAISNRPETLETLIDSRQKEQALSDNPLFQRTLRHPQFGRSLFTSYSTVEGLFQSFSTTARIFPNSPLALLLPALGSGLAKRFSIVDSHVWLEGEGIHSQANVYYTSPHPERATQVPTVPDRILNRLPAATYLSANSRNFRQQWQSWTKGSSGADSLIFKGVQGSFKSTFGLDLEKDLIPWLDGEYVFFLYPSSSGFFNQITPNFDLGVGLMVQTSDRPAAEAALQKLNQHIQKTFSGQVKLVPQRINQQPVMSWEGKDRNKTVSILAYSWLDSNTLILTSGAGAMAQVNPKPYFPLDLTYTFQTATATLPLPNAGYFYINMGSSLSLIYSLVLPPPARNNSPLVQDIQRVLGSIRSVSTTNSSTAEAMRIDTLWVMGKQKPTGAKSKD
jgi:hypothetical protein